MTEEEAAISDSPNAHRPSFSMASLFGHTTAIAVGLAAFLFFKDAPNPHPNYGPPLVTYVLLSLVVLVARLVAIVLGLTSTARFRMVLFAPPMLSVILWTFSLLANKPKEYALTSLVAVVRHIGMSAYYALFDFVLATFIYASIAIVIEILIVSFAELFHRIRRQLPPRFVIARRFDE